MLHRAVEGPVADDRMSSLPSSCCCWRGTCRVGLRWLGGGRRGRGKGVARSRPCGAAQRSCTGAGPLPRAAVPNAGSGRCSGQRLLPTAGAQLWTASFCWGGWLVRCGATTHAERSVAACNRRPPSSTSASTSGLSRPVLPRRLWRVVGWVGFLSDVIGGVESALWEGWYPALTLAHGV